MPSPRFSRNVPPPRNTHRINLKIRVPNVRVVRDGEQLGIIATHIARQMAADDGLDLVEVAPTAVPPVCHIIDYGKFKFDQSVKEKEQRKKTKRVEDKEIRLRPGIDDNDIVTKLAAARKFIEEGRKVQFVLEFKGRSIVHKDRGFEVIKRIVQELADTATTESSPRLDGKRIVCRLEPKK